MKRLFYLFVLLSVLTVVFWSCNKDSAEMVSAQRIDQIGDVTGEFSAVSLSDTVTQNFTYDKTIPYQGSLYVEVFVDTIDTPGAFVTRLQTSTFPDPTANQWTTADSVSVNTLTVADTVYRQSIAVDGVSRFRLQYFQSDGAQSNRVGVAFKLTQNR